MYIVSLFLRWVDPFQRAGAHKTAVESRLAAKLEQEVPPGHPTEVEVPVG